MKQASVHDFSIEECKLFEGIKCDKCKVCESEMEKWLISKGVKTITKRFINHDDTIVDAEGEQLVSTDEIADKMNELHEENRELKRINMIHEEQISELRRLVHIANDWISDDKKEEWKKELMRE